METLKRLLFGKKKDEDKEIKDSWGQTPPEQEKKPEKKPVKKGEWAEPKPETKQERVWKSIEKSTIPGHRQIKRILAIILLIIYVATLFTVALEPYTAGLVLITIYIMLDYLMLMRE